jgi:hypothetical protein
VKNSQGYEAMAVSDDEQFILGAIKTRFAGVARYKLDTARILETKSFLLGSISRVQFNRQDNTQKTIYVWSPGTDASTGKLRGDIEIFLDMNQLIPFVSRARGKEESLLSKIGPVDIVSGLIAVLMTVALIFVVFHQVIYQEKFDIPVVLSNVITIIVGFYFGRATTNPNVSPD